MWSAGCSGTVVFRDTLPNKETELIGAVLTFTAYPSDQKGEGDSCQSFLIVAPLNSGVNGFLPDVNTA